MKFVCLKLWILGLIDLLIMLTLMINMLTIRKKCNSKKSTFLKHKSFTFQPQIQATCTNYYNGSVLNSVENPLKLYDIHYLECCKAIFIFFEVPYMTTIGSQPKIK